MKQIKKDLSVIQIFDAQSGVSQQKKLSANQFPINLVSFRSPTHAFHIDRLLDIHKRFQWQKKLDQL